MCGIRAGEEQKRDALHETRREHLQQHPVSITLVDEREGGGIYFVEGARVHVHRAEGPEVRQCRRLESE